MKHHEGVKFQMWTAVGHPLQLRTSPMMFVDCGDPTEKQDPRDGQIVGETLLAPISGRRRKSEIKCPFDASGGEGQEFMVFVCNGWIPNSDTLRDATLGV